MCVRRRGPQDDPEASSSFSIGAPSQWAMVGPGITDDGISLRRHIAGLWPHRPLRLHLANDHRELGKLSFIFRDSTVGVVG